MVRRIPPLNPLHVFEAAARLGNFTRASEELHVTQSAVSRQVSTLEGYLGVQLFERTRSGVELTRMGRLFFADIGPAFSLIANATDKVIFSSRTSQVRVRTYTTFMAKWLMRRMSAFHKAHPDIEVKLTAATAPVDFSRDEIDVAIQVGVPPFPGAISNFLFSDEIEPVCSPKLVNGLHPIEAVEDLVHQRLLHSHYRRGDWSDWLRFAGHPELAANNNGMTFNTSVLTYQAAIEGMGVAMGQLRLLDQELESGLLVRPLKKPLCRVAAYHVLTPERVALSPMAKSFRDWLLTESAGR